MAVYAAAIAAVLFYSCAVPVKFVLAAHIAARSGFGVGSGIFHGGRAMKRARLRACGEIKSRPRPSLKTDIDKTAALHAAWRAGGYLLRHMHLDALQAQGRLCLSDAAHTALACGGTRMLEGMLAPFAQGRVQLHLQPDFSAAHSDLQLSCMVSLRAGHIICAALIGAWTYIKRRTPHGKASD